VGSSRLGGREATLGYPVCALEAESRADENDLNREGDVLGVVAGHQVVTSAATASIARPMTSTNATSTRNTSTPQGQLGDAHHFRSRTVAGPGSPIAVPQVGPYPMCIRMCTTFG